MRCKRNLINDGVYHVIARSNRQEFIFDSDYIKEMFIKVLKEARKKYHFRIDNFCIMGNHIHLLLKPLESASLSKIMQWILSKFAVKFNKYYNYRGHVWYDRFKSIVIESLKQFFSVNEYIDNNPVKAGIVKKPEDYYYCGITFLKKRIFSVVDPPAEYFYL